LTCFTEGGLETADLKIVGTAEEEDLVEVDTRGVSCKCYRQILLSLLLNPDTADRVKIVYEEWGKINKMVGFYLGADMRYWCFIVSDFGASCLQLIDSPTGGPFRNFVHIIGTFHECKEFLEVTMDILFSIGGGDLAYFHTYESDKAQAYLRRAGDIHKGNDFLRHVVKPALYIALIYECSKSTGVPICELTVDAVYEWAMDCSVEDLKFRNIIFFLTKILPSYEIVKKGVRSGHMEAYNAGRRFLLIFIFALGKINYGPLIGRDMIQYYHRAPPEVRQLMRDIFSIFDEGFDGKIEESNKAQKSFVLSPTERGIQCGALLSDVSGALRDSMSNLCHGKSDAEKRDRIPTDLDPDISDCARYAYISHIHLSYHTCMHTYTYPTIHACIHTLILHTCIHTYIHTYMHAYT
jgi:hypothetical protein